MSGNILFLGNKIFEIPPFFQTRPGDLGKKVHACSIRFSALKLRTDHGQALTKVYHFHLSSCQNFRRVVTFGMPCETSHAHDFVSAKSHAREKPLLAEYSDQFGIAFNVYHFPHFLQKKKLHFVLLRWRLS